MRLLALLLACALAACAADPVPVAIPVAESSCKEWEPIRAIAPAAAHLTEIVPAAPFLAALNKLPPESDISADHVWVARRGRGEARVFFVTGGCLDGAVDIPLEVLAELLGQDS